MGWGTILIFIAVLPVALWVAGAISAMGGPLKPTKRAKEAEAAFQARIEAAAKARREGRQ